ncbi:hypothetical protein [Marinobacter salarius]|uniref:Uncharacterized protein n=1 Tax=Marinobacter salarius TaxID=1420917 RepID=A0A1W6KFS7_9GAMM|nr:hypothetical protein [Marinobacter salarius]ARM86260.1 hypothetical protein MARSALSMR5_04243 [Marinobacter salarius]
MATVPRKHFYWMGTLVLALLLSGIPFCIEAVIAVAILFAFPELKGSFEPSFAMIVVGTLALLIVNWIPAIVLLHRHQAKGGGPMPIGKKGLSGYVDVPGRF